MARRQRQMCIRDSPKVLAASEDMIELSVFNVCCKTAPTTDFPLDIFLIKTLSGFCTLGCEIQFPPRVSSPPHITEADISRISFFSTKLTLVEF